MQITPPVTVTRFAELNAGDFFIYRHSENTCIAMVAEDPINNGQRLILPLGPNLPSVMKWPTLQSPRAITAVSFGKNVVLRLPINPSGWTDAAPPVDTHAILLVDGHAYFRASYSRDPSQFQPCFVEIASGLLHVSGSGLYEEYSQPSGVSAFAVEWEIISIESRPRVILARP